MRALLLILCGVFLMTGPVMAAGSPTLIPNALLYDRSDDQFASAIVLDAATMTPLYSYLPDQEWPAASLTKLMNALVTVDQKPVWTKTVALTSKDFIGGGQLSVKVGSRMRIQDLLFSSLIASSNNAAVALARTSGLGMDGFVKQMNVKATELGLKTSHFVDPSGLDPQNVTTAAEMAQIAARAFSVPMIRRAATTATYSFAVSNPSVTKKITNTNNLLTKDEEMYVLGGKTGFLYESRYNLAVRMRPMKEDPSTPPLIVVVLGAPTYSGSFAAAKGLAKWAWRAYDWQSP